MNPLAVATLLDSLADAITTGFPAHVSRERYLSEIATAVEHVPLVHPIRETLAEWPGEKGELVPVVVDRAVLLARAIRKGTATPEGLRAFAVELREGEAKMRLTGWGWLLP